MFRGRYQMSKFPNIGAHNNLSTFIRHHKQTLLQKRLYLTLLENAMMKAMSFTVTEVESGLFFTKQSGNSACRGIIVTCCAEAILVYTAPLLCTYDDK